MKSSEYQGGIISEINKERKYFIIECEVCGKHFEQQARLYKKSKWKNRCHTHRRLLIEVNDKYVIPKRKNTAVQKNRNCKDCKKPIWQGSTRCKSCAQKGYSKSGEKIISKYCKKCGIKISRQAKKYCLKCWNLTQDKGLSRERTKFTLSIEWKNVRIDCFNRDNYTCQHCGIKNSRGLGKTVKLNAHHIKYYREAPELRLELRNLITVCESCHYKIHANDKGEGRANTKLTAHKVREIKKLIYQGVAQKYIAEQYDISQSSVSHIANGRTWSHIT
jgi:5-methylcytosine-specific restriction enzyme A